MTARVPSPCGTPSPTARAVLSCGGSGDGLQTSALPRCKSRLTGLSSPWASSSFELTFAYSSSLESPRFFLPLRSDIGTFTYVWSTHTSPESTLFPAFSGILCIFLFHSSAVCRETCSLPCLFRRWPWQYRHSTKNWRDLFPRSKTCSQKDIRMILSGSSGTGHRGKLLYQAVTGLGTQLI